VGCGFSAGARFLIILDTTTGINANGSIAYFFTRTGAGWSGVDHSKALKTSGSDLSTTTGTVDLIGDSLAGFTITQNTSYNLNVTGRNYIYLAMA
jgi:hypothetical protein